MPPPTYTTSPTMPNSSCRISLLSYTFISPPNYPTTSDNDNGNTQPGPPNLLPPPFQQAAPQLRGLSRRFLAPPPPTTTAETVAGQRLRCPGRSPVTFSGHDGLDGGRHRHRRHSLCQMTICALRHIRTYYPISILWITGVTRWLYILNWRCAPLQKMDRLRTVPVRQLQRPVCEREGFLQTR